MHTCYFHYHLKEIDIEVYFVYRRIDLFHMPSKRLFWRQTSKFRRSTEKIILNSYHMWDRGEVGNRYTQINNVHRWLLANKLTLNVKKTEYMLIGSRQRLSQIDTEPIWSIESESIKRVSSTKTLGVIVDECITWKDHIDKVAKKASKGIGMLRRSKDLLDKNTLKTIYNERFCFTALWLLCTGMG